MTRDPLVGHQQTGFTHPGEFSSEADVPVGAGGEYSLVGPIGIHGGDVIRTGVAPGLVVI